MNRHVTYSGSFPSGRLGRGLFCRVARVLLCLSVLSLVGGALAAPAQAGGDPIGTAKYPDFRKALLGDDKGTRKGTLKLMLHAPRDNHPGIYGNVVGPIFSDKALTASMGEDKRRALFAILIAHLADEQATDGNLLLAEQFLPLLAADAKLVHALREEGALGKDPGSGRQTGWERILERAEVLLTASKDPLVRRAAIHLSATCECAKAADAVATLYDALKAGGAATPEDAAAYLDAAELLLQKRFENTGRLLTFLELFAPQFKGRTNWTLADRYRIRAELLSGVLELMKAKGGQRTTQARQAALAYGSELIQLIAKSGKPEELVVFFKPGRERYEELQRKALKAARENLKPQANQGWATLLDRALSHSDDPQVLADVITVLSSTFKKRTKDSELLAAAIARRIQRRPAADSVRHRKELADRLGFIGALADVRAALPANLFQTNGEQKAVYEALIRDIGLVKNGLVAALLPYYYRKEGAQRPPEWARLAVASALGYQGLGKNGHQGRFAALMLRHILTGTPVTAEHNQSAGIAEKKDYLLLGEASPEEASVVRKAAVISLLSYPGAATAGVLREIAASDPEIAPTALRILGRQLGRGSKDAALALAKLIEEGLPDERLLETLDVIAGNSAPAGAAERKALATQVRASLQGQDVSGVLRARAAVVAAHLGDAKAIMPAFVNWKAQQDEKARAVWLDLLRGIAVAAAKAGATDPGSIKVLYDQLRAMATENFRAEVLGFFAAMGPEADLFELKRLRADIHYERPSVSEGRSREDQRKDMEQALALYRALVGESKGADQLDVRRSLYRVLTEGITQALLAEGEHLDSFNLQAYKVAAESGSPPLAREALQKLRPALVGSSVLSEPQKSDVARLTKKLQVLAAK